MAEFYLKTKVGLDTSTIQPELNKLKPILTVTTNLKGGGTKEVTTFRDKVGNTVKVMKTFNSEGKLVSSTLQSVKENTQTASTSIGRLGQDFVTTTGKVLKFGLSTAVIGAFTKGIADAISTVKEFDDAITEMGKVSDYSGDQLTLYAEQLGELGTSVSRTRTEMVQGATDYLKAGFTEEEASQLSKITALYQNTADEVLSASDATSVIVSQMKAFNVTADDSIHIIDSINKVSADFAVSSGDIGKGLTFAGSALSTYGNDFDEVVGLVTAGTEIFQGKSQQVARGLNQIASRVAKNESALAQYGVAIKDSSGDLRSTYDILSDLAPEWDKMSNAEQVALGTTLAGTNQYKIFSAVMGNFDVAVRATNESLDSFGSTEKQNEVYMESLGAKTNNLKAQLQELILGNGGLSNFAKTLVDAGTSVLKFANSDIGQLIIKMGALLTAFALFDKYLNVTRIVNFIKNIVTMDGAVKLLTTEFLKNAMAWAMTPMGMATIAVAAITAIVVAVNKFSDSLENNQKKLEELSNEYEDAQQSVSDISEKLQNVKDKIDEINKTEGAKVTKKGELAELKREETKLSNLLKIEKERERLAKQKYEEQAKKTIYKKVSETKTTPTGTSRSNYGNAEVNIVTGEVEQNKISKDRVQILKDIAIAMQKQSDIATKLQDRQRNGIKLTEEENNQLNKATDEYDRLSEMGSEYSKELENEIKNTSATSETREYAQKSIDAYADAIKNTTSEQEENTESQNDNANASKNNANSINELTDAQKKLAKELGISNSALIKNSKQMGISVDEYLEYAKAIEKINNRFDNLQSNYSTLKSIVSDYNDNQKISVDTLQDYLNLSPEYQKMLSFENGKLILNKNAIAKKTKAIVSETKQQITQNAINELNALTEQKVAQEKLETARASINSASDWHRYQAQIESTTTSLNKNSEAEAKNQTIKGAKEKAKKAGVSDKEINKIVSDYKKQIKMVNSLGSSVKDYTSSLDSSTKSVGKSTKGHNANTKATNKNEKAKKALQKQIDGLNKKQDKYLKGLNDEKDLLEKTKDKLEKKKDAIEDQISIYEKLFDAIEDVVNKDKEELESQIDKTNEYYDSLIDNIETEMDAINEKYDEEANAIDKVNEEREKAIALQEKESNLAKALASKKMVFKDGSFQLISDESAIESAQKALFEQQNQDEIEKRKQEIEEKRNKELYDLQLRKELLDNERNQKLKSLNSKLEELENYLKLVEEKRNAYSTDMDKKLIQQYMNGNAYNKELLELNAYNYYKEQEQRDALQVQIDNVTKKIESIDTRIDNYSKKMQEKIDLLSALLEKIDGSSAIGSIGISKNGNGSDYISNDTISLVGDNPNNQELVIGSKLNGSLMSLPKGSGVVNAKSTRTLSGLLNNLPNLVNGGNSNYSQNQISNSNSTNISIGNISLPNVSDANDFIDAMQNFNLNIIQKAY